ncbi:addiction module protein [Scytonema sp. UIC 10036]|uniref:addiction module protein n=1 Tax=Scytonema sp. UIC 10036 TaxID=2304196 RepID=UPI001FA950DB|nr:addiction module protein [Scytonema sp. UIC 10036]
MTYDDIFGAALALTLGLRTMLAEHLLKSLDAFKQMVLDDLWVEEVEKRVQEVEQGVVTPIVDPTNACKCWVSFLNPTYGVLMFTL